MSASGNGTDYPDQGELGLEEEALHAAGTDEPDDEAQAVEGDDGRDDDGGSPEPDERATTQLIINKEGRWRVLADGTREEVSQEAWQAELTRRFNRSE